MSHVPAAIDEASFRQAMGRFATGVTVVTTAETGEVHGMTANGFLSVSLRPPLVLVSLGHRCRTRSLLSRTWRYGISVLSDDQEAISRHFAGRPVPGLKPDFTWIEDTPFISGALAHIGCRLTNTYPAGDHSLCIGQVEHLSYRDGQPLVFFTGSYRLLHVGVTEDFFSHRSASGPTPSD